MARRRGKKKAKTVRKVKASASVEMEASDSTIPSTETEMQPVSQSSPSTETEMQPVSQSSPSYEMEFEVAPPYIEGDESAYAQLMVKKELIDEAASNRGVSNGTLPDDAPSENSDANAATPPLTVNIKVEAEDNLSTLADADVLLTNTVVDKEKEKSQKSCEIVTSEDMHQSVQESQNHYFPPLVTKQEACIDDLGESNNSEEAERAGTLVISSCSETATVQKCDEAKRDNQSDCMQFSISELKIKQELLNNEDNSSFTIPSFGFSKVNTVKTSISSKMFNMNNDIQDSAILEPETKFNDIQNSTASISDNNISSPSFGAKERDDCSSPNNPNSNKLLFSRQLSINDDQSVASSINSICSGNIESSSGQERATLSPTELSSKIAPETEYVIGTSNVPCSNMDIDNSMNSKQPIISHDLSDHHSKEIGDIYSASTSLDSYPMSISPTPSSNASNENSNTNNFSIEDVNGMERNILNSENQMANIPTLPHPEGFLLNWQPSEDDSDNESLFAEMACYFCRLGFEMKKEDNSQEFCRRVLLKDVEIQDFYECDRLALDKLFPTEPVKSEETSVSSFQNDEFIKKMDVHSILDMNDYIIKAELDGQSQVVTADQMIETSEIDQENQNIVLEPEREKQVTFNAETTLHAEQQKQQPPEINLQAIVQGLSTETLQDIIKTAFSNPKIPGPYQESCSIADPCVEENNSMHNELVSSTNIFKDANETNYLPSNSLKEMPTVFDSSHNDSDDSVGNDGMNGNSDDSGATVRNSPVDRELSPKISPRENCKPKARDQSPVLHQRKKRRYDIIMERKEKEKALQNANNSLKGKSGSYYQKSKSTTSYMNAKDQSAFASALQNPNSEKRKLPLSRNKCNGNEREKIMRKGTKMFASDKNKDMESSSRQVEGRASKMRNDEMSDVSNLVEMGAGNRFKNRNSSLFQDMTKSPQQPLSYRYKQGRQKTSHALPNQPSIEEVHGQIETSISIPPAKKRILSYSDYMHRKSSLPPPLNPDNDSSRYSTRTLLPNIPQSTVSYPIQDPRLARKQGLNHDANFELRYISGYHPNCQTDSSILNTSLHAIPASHHSVSNAGHITWNSFSPREADASLSMGPIMNSNFLPHLNDNLPSSNPLQSLSPIFPSDDVDLSSTEPFVQQSLFSGYFNSSHGVQQFGPSSSFTQSQDQRLTTTTSHPTMPVPSTIPPGNHPNLPPRPNESYEVNLLPIGLLESIGKSLISPTEALMIILSWTPIWLDEADAQPLHPPPILGRKEKILKEVKLCYKDTNDNFNINFPLMMHDLFFRIRDTYKDHKTRGLRYELDMIKVVPVGDMMEIVAHMVVPKKTFPSVEGQLAIVTFTLLCGKKRDHFVYVSHHKLLRDYPGNFMQQDVWRLHMKTMNALINVDKKAKLSMLVFYPLTKALNQVKVLNAIDKSPLRDIILKPIEPSCSRFVLEIIGSMVAGLQIINCAVERIQAGISLDDQESPRVLLVEAPTGTDLMSTLLALIEDVKKLPQKHKILLCPKTAKRLEEMGLRLLSTGGRTDSTPRIQTVILAKSKAFLQPEMKKLTLEDQVYQRIKFVRTIRDSNIEETESPSEAISEEEEKLEARKYVLGNCDVLLSNIVQCYDNVVASFFGVGKQFQFSVCIIDESYACTEPEAFLPLLYGIRKLILVGDPVAKPRHIASVNVPYGFYRPLPLRISQCIRQ